MSTKAESVGSIIEDRPITKGADDKLDREAFVANLVRSLIQERVDSTGKICSASATGLVVGLTGSWGLGKSSVLQLVRERLKSHKHVAVAYINPWIFNTRDDLIKVYFNELRNSVGRSDLENAREIKNAIAKYQGAIQLAAAGISLATKAVSFLFGVPVIGWAVASVISKTSSLLRTVKKSGDANIVDERKSLEKKLKRSRVAVVVLIDELDRLEDSEVHAVSQMIKAVGDIEGISLLMNPAELRRPLAKEAVATASVLEKRISKKSFNILSRCGHYSHTM